MKCLNEKIRIDLKVFCKYHGGWSICWSQSLLHSAFYQFALSQASLHRSITRYAQGSELRGHTLYLLKQALEQTLQFVIICL